MHPLLCLRTPARTHTQPPAATYRLHLPPSSCRLPQGLDVTSLREIKVLRELSSPHIVNVLDIVPHKKKFTMVSEARVAVFTPHTVHLPPSLPCCPRPVPPRPRPARCLSSWTVTLRL